MEIISRSHTSGRWAAFLRPAAARCLLGLGVLAAFSSGTARAVNIETVVVGNPGNPPDTTGFGAVASSYALGKYEVSNGQYAAFLNAVDPNGTNPYGIFHTGMHNESRGGILFQSYQPVGVKYAAKSDMANKPVNFVNWFDAARFANWVHNGQQTFASTAASTPTRETGAYTLNGVLAGAIPRNPEAKWWIPTEDQWYKAAYYKGGGTTAGYWIYPTASSFAPSSVGADAEGDGPGSTGNSANFNKGAVWKPSTEENTSATANPTTVGMNGRSSPSGAFDMGGNVWEINDAVFSNARGRRGGGYDSILDFLASSFRGTSPFNNDTSVSNDGIVTYTLATMQQGFRLATGIDPRLGTTSVVSIYSNAVTLSSNLVDTGGATLIELGFIYADINQNSNPMLGGYSVTKVVTPGTSQGTYNQIIKTLTPGRTYAIRAFATSATGNGYGGLVEATTLASGPNAAPTDILLNPASLAEGGSVPLIVGSFSAVDENLNDYHGFSLAAGDGATDNSAFSIQRSGDVWNLVLNQSADFETKAAYSIRVFTADNGTGLLGFSKAFSIAVTDINESPRVTSHGGAGHVSLSREENQSAVTTVTATDPDLPSQTLVFSISGGVDAGSFVIDGASGALSFANTPDREIPTDSNFDNIYQVVVRVTDSGIPSNFAEQSFAVTVTDLPEAPSLTGLSVSGVTGTSAVFVATVADAGAGAVTSRGFVFAPAASSSIPQLGGNGVVEATAGSGPGAFTATTTALISNTDYVVRAYAQNLAGLGYSETFTFTSAGTDAPPLFSYATPQELPLLVAMPALRPMHTGGRMSGSRYRLVSTWAGSGAAGAADGSGTSATFKRPFGLTLDAAGNAYVADTHNHKIRRIAADGAVTTLAGDGYEIFWNGRLKNANGTAASFNYPAGIAIDLAGANLYVADTNNHVIRRISLTVPYAVTTFAGSTTGWLDNATGTSAKFKEPKGLAIDANGTFLYVADSGNHRIRKINLSTAAVSTVAGSGTAGTTDGTATAATFNVPTGLALNGSGSLFVSDFTGRKIRRVDVSSAAVTTVAGSGTAASTDGTGSAAAFNGPYGVALDGAGNLYVAEELGNVIRLVTPAGQVSTLAGDGTATAADGVGTSASFDGPAGIAVHPNGSLYVTHSSATATTGNLIRRVSISGYTLNPALPAGISLNPLSGVISGTPGEIKEAANYGVTAYNYYGQSTASLSLAVVLRPVFGASSGPFLTTSGFVASGNSLAIALGFSPAPHRVLTVVNNLATGPVTGTFTDLPEGALLAAAFGGETFHFRISYRGGNGNDITLTRTVGIAQQETYEVGTLAGGYFGSTDGTGEAARFSQPWGIACDFAGNLYVSDDSANPRVRKITPAGVVSTFAGGASGVYYGHADGSAAYARFYNPRGLGVDLTGNVFVADTSNHRIRKITQSSISSSIGSMVSTVTGDGTATFLDGTGIAARLNAPEGVAVDAAGNVYVADTSNQRIRKITPAGVVTTVAGSGNLGRTNGSAASAKFWNPAAITLDPAGNLYVAESNGNAIRKITPEGIVSNLAGGGGNLNTTVKGTTDGPGSSALFSGPRGIAWHPSGDLIVADTDNHRVRRIRPDGVVSTIAGSSAGFAEGAGESALFNTPWSLAVDAAGVTYVADSSNRRIRRITSGARPIIQLDSVTDLAAGEVTLHGKVNPNGFGTSARFDYGPTPMFGLSVPLTLDSPKSTSLLEVSAALEGLESNTVYHYRLVASNLDGSAERSGTFVVVNPDFSAAYDVPITADGFSAAGLPFGDLSIGFSPAVHTALMLVDNTANSPVAGSFSGLPEGSVITSTHDGNNFNFQLSYVGGDGNDITLTRIAKPGQISNGSVWQVTTVAGQLAGNPMFQPMGITRDPAGNLYVADWGVHVIWKVTPAGQITNLAGTSGTLGTMNGTGQNARFSSPHSIVVDSQGNLYVSDHANHAIRKIAAGGVVTTFAGLVGTAGLTDATGSAARFRNPRGMTIDGTGNIFVADNGNGKVRKITPEGVVTTLPSGQFYNADGIGVYSDGTPVVSNYSAYSIVKALANGTNSIIAGNYSSPGSADGTGAAARFGKNSLSASEIHLGVDHIDNIYAADTLNHTIRKVTPAGVVTTIAGEAGISGTADGISSSSKFYNPRGLHVAATGELYVVDGLNKRIRRMTSATQPIVSVLGATGIQSTRATLRGTVNPNGYMTSARFEYGISTDYGSSVSINLADPASQAPQAVSAEVTGLVPAQTYYYRVVATNLDGTTISSSGSFPSANPPVLASAPTSGNVTYRSATMAGRVENDGGIPILECGILWAPANGASELVLGADGVSRVISGNLAAGNFSVATNDVSPATTYRFRAYAISAAGTSYSADTSSFTTSSYAMASVLVGDAGNVSQRMYYSYDQFTLGEGTFGGVAYEFRMGQYEVTNFEYAAFLNAVDPEGLNPAGIYNSGMTSDPRGGINLVSAAATGSKYVAKPAMRFKPVNWISWFDAARFANWMHHGSPVSTTTADSATFRETGAYTLNGATSGLISRNADATAWIPSENEWIKAAYYKGGSLNAGFLNYATTSSASSNAPAAITANASGDGIANGVGHTVNWLNGAVWNGQIGNVTTVGTNGAPSAYGTYDQDGNMPEWTDTSVDSFTKAVRGGGWNSGGGVFENGMYWANPSQTGLGDRKNSQPTGNAGFRIALSAAPVVVAVPVLNPVASASLITSSGAKLAGEVTANGGGAITGRGIVYAPTSSNFSPELGGTTVVDLPATGTTGIFSVDVSGLLSEAAYTFRAYATNSAGTSYSAAVTFTTLAAQTLSPSETWRQQYFGMSENSGNAADLATPDGDGIANLMKYALGLTPGQSSVAGLPKAKIATASGSRYLSLNLRRDPSRNDVTILVEVQGNLGGTWTEIASSVNGAAFTGPAGVTETAAADGAKDVEIRDTQTIGSAARRFMRVRVVR